MKDEEAEISLFDIAEWFWSFKWLMLACAIVAIAWIALAWQNVKATPPSFNVNLQIFSGGTPVRTPEEISDILAAKLDVPGVERLSAPAANPLHYRAADMEKAEAVQSQVDAIVKDMLAEVSAQQDELQRLLTINETALPQYLEAKSFVESVTSGLISPVVTEISSADTSTTSKITSLVLPVVVCGFVFLLIAGTISFIREWKQRHQVAAPR